MKANDFFVPFFPDIFKSGMRMYCHL